MKCNSFEAMNRATWVGAFLLQLLAMPDIGTAAEIKVLSGSAIESAMHALIPTFEQSSGHKVVFDFNGTIGGMTDRVRHGEPADVVIVSRPQIAQLEIQGRVVPGSLIDIAKVGVGLVVRLGSARPDIDSFDAFARAMHSAKSIGWNDPAAGAPVSIYMLGVFERLGIANAMRPKTR